MFQPMAPGKRCRQETPSLSSVGWKCAPAARHGSLQFSFKTKLRLLTGCTLPWRQDVVFPLCAQHVLAEVTPCLMLSDGCSIKREENPNPFPRSRIIWPQPTSLLPPRPIRGFPLNTRGSFHPKPFIPAPLPLSWTLCPKILNCGAFF